MFKKYCAIILLTITPALSWTYDEKTKQLSDLTKEDRQNIEAFLAFFPNQDYEKRKKDLLEKLSVSIDGKALSQNNMALSTSIWDALKRLTFIRKLTLENIKAPKKGIFESKAYSVPAEIYALKELKEIVITNSAFTGFSLPFQNFFNLIALKITQTPFTELPANFMAFELQSFHISTTKIQRLPETLSKSTQLRTLFLENNDLREIPDSFLEQMTELTTLALAGNKKLKGIPKTLQCTKLVATSIPDHLR